MCCQNIMFTYFVYDRLDMNDINGTEHLMVNQPAECNGLFAIPDLQYVLHMKLITAFFST